MVLQNVGNVLDGQILEGRTDVLESLVGRSEDCQVRSRINGLDELSSVQSTVQGGQVGGESSGGDILGEGENGVNDVNHATSEVEVLYDISLLRFGMHLSQGSYSLGDSGVLQKPTEEGDIIANADSLDNLSTSHIGILSLHQCRGDESARVGNLTGGICSV